MKQATIKRFVELDYFGNEALNSICSNLSFARRAVKKIVVTSCNEGEGKSFVTMHIAQNLSRRGRRVVVVDADMRRSFLIKQYKIETDGKWSGLAHYLAGYSSLDDILYETDLNGMYFIPAGRDVSNPIPLLDTQYFTELLERLAEIFDVVLVDAPPLGVVIDAAEMAKDCDGAIFVVEYDKTRRRDMKKVRDQLEQTGCPILGCVINKVTFDSLSSKKYYNKSYYSHYNGEYYRRSSHARSADEDAGRHSPSPAVWRGGRTKDDI